jgi:hypothetical protein
MKTTITMTTTATEPMMGSGPCQNEGARAVRLLAGSC